jgi:hypothetical protein
MSYLQHLQLMLRTLINRSSSSSAGDLSHAVKLQFCSRSVFEFVRLGSKENKHHVLRRTSRFILSDLYVTSPHIMPGLCFVCCIVNVHDIVFVTVLHLFSNLVLLTPVEVAAFWDDAPCSASIIGAMTQ